MKETLQLKGATSVRRSLAALLDLVCCAPLTALPYATGLFSLSAWKTPTDRLWPDFLLESWQSNAFGIAHPFLFTLVVWCVWQLLWMLLYNGRTPGCLVARVRLVDHLGDPVRIAQLSLRVLGHVACALTLGLGWFWTYIVPSRRTWPDVLSRTYLIKT